MIHHGITAKSFSFVLRSRLRSKPLAFFGWLIDRMRDTGETLRQVHVLTYTYTHTCRQRTEQSAQEPFYIWQTGSRRGARCGRHNRMQGTLPLPPQLGAVVGTLPLAERDEQQVFPVAHTSHTHARTCTFRYLYLWKNMPGSPRPGVLNPWVATPRGVAELFWGVPKKIK